MGDANLCVLEARALYHIYKEGTVETVALRGTGIRVEGGTWTSVMGASGSGKSTLLHVLAGLLVPTAGAVVVDGRDLAHMSATERARWRRSRVGVVLQYDNLHPLLDTAGNVSLPLRLEGLPRAERRRRVPELLKQVGLTERSGHRVSQLSGGEAQRTAVAVALALQPAVLLADEPTGELDETTANEVLDLLSTLREQGTAVVTVTHNPQVA
ncbi:MAG: ABC transporter ATP-binding protein, partial [Nocardioidaceae bacterium]